MNSTVSKHTLQSHAQLARTLTLLRVFLLASAVILCAGAFALTTVLTGTVRSQALDDAEVSLTQYVNGVLHDELVQDGEVTIAAADAIAERDLRSRPDILSVKVWSSDGTLAWTNLAQERIGTRYPLEGHLGEAVEDGVSEAELESLERRRATMPSSRSSASTRSSRSTRRSSATTGSRSAPTRSTRMPRGSKPSWPSAAGSSG